jgi:hypothetical protein
MKNIIKNNFLHAPAGKISEQSLKNIRDDLNNYLKFKNSLTPEGRHKIHLLIPSIYDLSTDKEIIKNVESFTGSQSVLWYSVLFHKKKQSKLYIPWHYDDYFWNIEGEGCTVWVAVNDVDLDMGPMEFAFEKNVKEITHRVNNDPNNILSRGNIASYEPSFDTQIEKVPLNSGEYSIHSNKVMHRSGINTSEKDRLAFALRYISINSKSRSFRFLKRGAVTNYDIKKNDCFYIEKKPKKILKPFRSPDHLRSVFFSILVTFFGDTKRKLPIKIFDFLKFIFFKILGFFGVKNKKDDKLNQG